VIGGHGEFEDVVAGAAIDREYVVAGAAVDRLRGVEGAERLMERVVAFAALDVVVPQAHQQRIVSVTEVDRGMVC